jgi:hypothetical protein
MIQTKENVTNVLKRFLMVILQDITEAAKELSTHQIKLIVLIAEKN